MPPREPQELPRPQAEPQGPQGQQRRPSINGLVNTAVLPTYEKICSKNVYVDWSVNPIHAGVFLVLLFKINVAPRKNFIWWNFFEKS